MKEESKKSTLFLEALPTKRAILIILNGFDDSNLQKMRSFRWCLSRHGNSLKCKLPEHWPGHSMELHSLFSEKFPGHRSIPSTAGSLQDRALNSTPLPQETVHWDQGLHSCHSVTAPAMTIDKWLYPAARAKISH